MLRIAICDDEQRLAERLGKIVRCFFEEKNIEAEIEILSNGSELLGSGKIFDLIFLDIEMEGVNGIEAGKRIRQYDVDVPIVYVTSHSGYWRSAYQVHAFEFVEKPVEKERIYEVLSDFIHILNEKRRKVIELKTEHGVVLQDMQEIYYFIVSKKRTVLVKTKQGEFFVKENLAGIYEKLDKKQFFMAHRSDIVNLDYIDHIKEYDIYMKNGDWIPLAQKKRKEFLLKINEFVF